MGFEGEGKQIVLISDMGFVVIYSGMVELFGKVYSAPCVATPSSVIRL